MDFNFELTLRILKNTPTLLTQTINGLPPELLHTNEGPNTWSPYQVVGHLIHGEKTDWLPRIKIILEAQQDKTFTPYDRFAQQTATAKPIQELLSEFSHLRNNNLVKLQSLDLNPNDFSKTGKHPELGEVRLSELLSTWAVHDLSHLVQINRTLVKQFKPLMGPWPAYFNLLQ